MRRLKTGAPPAGAPSSLLPAGIALAIIAFLLTLYPGGPVLVIGVAGHRTLHWEVAPGQVLIYHYVHSLERVSVFEYLRIEEDGFRLAAVRKLPVGSPPPPVTGMGDDRLPPGSAILLRELRLLLTPAAAQSLSLGGFNLDLSGYDTGTPVVVRVVRIPRIWRGWRRSAA